MITLILDANERGITGRKQRRTTQESVSVSRDDCEMHVDECVAYADDYDIDVDDDCDTR
ncbi:Hypothetical protein CINCED_3A007151 [Cinara cedri]|uniref:Uncharacterized protein n=1 Tax=Cinara cedri TaxID=506608 RepID=A0A5E4N5W1_9HEMI|nr:Hypothetical protein CINCED_3A007151 [Cinara cedri]